MKKRVLFIDRDGTLILETDNFKIDSFDKLVFFPKVFQFLSRIAREMDYELVMVTNQDGLGKPEFPEDTFWPVHNFIMRTLEGEEIKFKEVLIDKSYPHENLPTRKAGTGMIKHYMTAEYDLENSFVIGDRITDVMLAKNINGKCIWLNDGRSLGADEIAENAQALKDYVVLETRDWEEVYNFLAAQEKKQKPLT